MILIIFFIKSSLPIFPYKHHCTLYKLTLHILKIYVFVLLIGNPNLIISVMENPNQHFLSQSGNNIQLIFDFHTETSIAEVQIHKINSSYQLMQLYFFPSHKNLTETVHQSIEIYLQSDYSSSIYTLFTHHPIFMFFVIFSEFDIPNLINSKAVFFQIRLILKKLCFPTHQKVSLFLYSAFFLFQ